MECIWSAIVDTAQLFLKMTLTFYLSTSIMRIPYTLSLPKLGVDGFWVGWFWFWLVVFGG